MSERGNERSPLFKARVLTNDYICVLGTRLPCTALPEVLAPAGGWPQLIAAIAAGADAVYLGIREFNARARAENFDITGSV